MARRKQEVALQAEIETQEDWDDYMTKDGLIVIDVYQEWCGPCTSMVAGLKRLRNELADDLLVFAAAKADTIDSLERYRGKSKPCYLFYAAGYLVNVIRGANSPVILNTITAELKYENKVLAGEAERKTNFVDPDLAEEDARRMAEKALADERDEADGITAKGVALLIAQPCATQSSGDALDTVKESLASSELAILSEQSRTFTEEEATEFLKDFVEEENYAELLAHYQSGESHLMIVCRGDRGDETFDVLSELLGPVEPTENPESLRGRFGQSLALNGFYGSADRATGERDVHLFFPDYEIPIAPPRPKMQKTVIIVPSSFSEGDRLAEVKAAFADYVADEIQVHEFDFYENSDVLDTILTDEAADGFENPADLWTDGASFVLLLRGMNIVQFVSDHIGPIEINAAREADSFGSSITGDLEQPVIKIKCPRDSDMAKRWISLLKIEKPEPTMPPKAPEEALEDEIREDVALHQVPFTIAVMKPDALLNRSDILEKIAASGLSIMEKKEVVLTAEQTAALYKNHVESEFWDSLVDYMTSGESLYCVITGDDALRTWREMVGPTDSAIAKAEAPETLRALYGESELKNAVGGTIDRHETDLWLKTIFGDVVVMKDGTLMDRAEFDAMKPEEQAEAAADEPQPAAAPAEKEKSSAAATPAPPPPAEEEAKAESPPAAAEEEKPKEATPPPPAGDDERKSVAEKSDDGDEKPAEEQKEEKAATPAPAEREKSAKSNATGAGTASATPAPAEKEPTPQPPPEKEKSIAEGDAPAPAPAEEEEK